MPFWCLHFPPKNKRKQVNLRYHSGEVKNVLFIFWRNRRLEKNIVWPLVCPVTTWTHNYRSKLLWYWLVSMVFESIKIPSLLNQNWVASSQNFRFGKIFWDSVDNIEKYNYLDIFVCFNQCAVHTPFRNPKIWTGQYLSPNS